MQSAALFRSRRAPVVSARPERGREALALRKESTVV
jgi:hypothetical protein